MNPIGCCICYFMQVVAMLINVKNGYNGKSSFTFEKQIRDCIT